MSKKCLISWAVLSVIAIIIQVWIWWVIKQPFNLHSSTTWWEMILFFVIIGGIGLCYSYFGSEYSYHEVISEDLGFAISGTITAIGGVLFVIWLIAICVSSSLFHSRTWYRDIADQVIIIEDSDEQSAFPNLLGSNNDTSNLPLLGTPEALKNAETLMGKQPALGSQYELIEAEVTSQNINNSLMYVVPLEPKSWLKWDGNNHGYFIVDRNNGKTEFVEEGLKTTESAPFGDNAKRIIYNYMQRNGIKGRIAQLSPEVDDDGNFRYVATVYTTGGVEGMDTVTGVIELDAMTKKCEYYELDEVPEYIDRVFPEFIFEDYIKYYGRYKNGWLNSIFGQREVLEPTIGLDIVYIDGVCWYYTGYTSTGEDSSNGIMMMNCRTGELRYYVTYGISENKAQAVAEGRVQEKEYTASYPLLLMVGGQETYFMLMRDKSNNLCGYSFVSYKDYTKASVADTLSMAQSQYIKAISTSNSADLLDNLDFSTGKAAITRIGSEVKDSTTVWYIMMEGNDHIFIVTSEMEPMIVFAKPGDIAEVSYIEAESTVLSANTFKVLLE